MPTAHSRLQKCKRTLATLATALLATLPASAPAATFPLPSDGSTIVGEPRRVIPFGSNTLLDIARHFDVGHHEITGANPRVDVWVPETGDPVLVPSQYILPPKPWAGIVINISQRRLFYFPAPAKGQPASVITFPISIAREGWATPLGPTTVVARHKDPAWFVPKSIQEEHRANGEELPEYFPPGPNNPMGMLAIQLGFKSIFIHGTNRPWGVGMRTSHGCLHLYPEDAATLFPLMKSGVPVRVIDEPVVVGVHAGQLHLARYEAVQEYGTSRDPMTRAVLALAPFLQSAVLPRADTGNGRQPADPGPRYAVDWQKLQAAIAGVQILPLSIAPDGTPLEARIRTLKPEVYEEEPYGIDANDASIPQRPAVPGIAE